MAVFAERWLHCVIFRPDFVMHYKSCGVSTTVTPYFTVVYSSKFMHKSWGIEHIQVMPFQSIRWPVTGINVFLRTRKANVALNRSPEFKSSNPQNPGQQSFLVP